LANAGKYSTTFFVVLFSTLNTAYALFAEKDKDGGGGYNPFFYLWISSSVIRFTKFYIFFVSVAFIRLP
jgi:hypothetical protein